MNQDRFELDRLKLRLTRVESKLIALQSEARELSEIRAAIAALELRLAASEPIDQSAPLSAFQEQEKLDQIEAAAPAGSALTSFPEAIETRAEVQPPALPPKLPEFQTRTSHFDAQPETEFQTSSWDEPEDAAASRDDTDRAGESNGSFEMRLGTYWLVRIGIVMLLTGMVFFGKYAYQNYIGKLGAGGKLTLLYLAAGGLLGAGAWIERRSAKENLKQYGQVLFGGGLAAVYFTTYAAHHVAALQVIRSAVIDGLLLLIWAGVMVWMADRKRSELLAVCGVGLAYYTSAVTNIGWFTLFSNLVLTLAAVGFLVRNRWITVSTVSLAATYAGYAFWRFYSDEGWRGAATGQTAELLPCALFLFGYWTAFTAAMFLSSRDTLAPAKRVTFATANNGAFFGLALATMLQLQQGEFWKLALGFGVVLIALTPIAFRRFSDEPILGNSYLTQGLLLVTLGIIGRFTGAQLALVLGAQSVLLMFLGERLNNRILRIASYAAAGIGTFFGTINAFKGMQQALAAVAVGGFMSVNAWRSAQREGEATKDAVRPGTLYFTMLCLSLWFAALLGESSPHWLAPAMALSALALTASVYFTKIHEFAVLGQGFLLFAQGRWTWGTIMGAEVLPWWNAVILLGVTLALIHWWNNQREMPAQELQILQAFYAVAVVGVLHGWLKPNFSAETWMAMAGLLGSGMIAYGLLTRARLLACTAQIFILISAANFLWLAWSDHPKWYWALVPMTVVGALSGVAANLAGRTAGPNAESTERSLRILSQVYQWAAAGMLVIWTHEYVSAGYRLCVLAVAGAVVFACVKWKPDMQRATLCGALTVVGVVSFLMAEREAALTAANFLGILLILAEQRLARSRPDDFDLKPEWHYATMILGAASLWIFTSRWMLLQLAGFYLTVSWGALALIMFLAGMRFRERMYRWIGLLLLAMALGRVGLIDVWKLEQFYRIVSFMGLGAVLLVLGFIYNRYQEKIREWL